MILLVFFSGSVSYLVTKNFFMILLVFFPKNVSYLVTKNFLVNIEILVNSSRFVSSINFENRLITGGKLPETNHWKEAD